jgi:hypothetical protein
MDDHQPRLEQLRDSFNSRNADAWIEVWNLDCEWHPFLTAREEGSLGYHGHNGMRTWFEDIDEMFERIHVELDQIRQVGDRILVLGRMTATRRRTGEEVDRDVGWVVEPKGERFQRGWSYDSHKDAKRAAEESAD